VSLATKGKAPGWLSLAALTVMYLIEYGVYKLFPRGTFAVGQGLTRHKELSVLRVGVVGAFMVSIVADWVLRHF